MAKQADRDLFNALRAHGLRKRVARTVADAAGRADARAPEVLRRSVRDLNSVLTDLERRARSRSGSSSTSRSEAAKKAARTRQRNSAKRSAAAKKGARTRAARS